MSVKKTITMPDALYERLQKEADMKGIPLNRLLVKHYLRGKSPTTIIDFQEAVKELAEIRNLFNRIPMCPAELHEEVRHICLSLESFLIKVSKT